MKANIIAHAECQIYRAKQSDLKNICHIFSICTEWLNHKGLFHWQNVYKRDKIFNNISKKNSYILREKNITVGTMTLSTLQPVYYPIETKINWNEIDTMAIYISGIAILPKFMNKGYATKLMQYAENKAIEKSIDYLRLDTVAHYNELNNFYKNRGYTIVEKREIFDFDNYFWEKKIINNKSNLKFKGGIYRNS